MPACRALSTQRGQQKPPRERAKGPLILPTPVDGAHLGPGAPHVPLDPVGERRPHELQPNRQTTTTANRRCQLRVKPHEVVWHKQAARRIFSFTFVWLCAVGCVLLAWLARLHLVKLASQLRGLVHEPQIRRMHTCQGMQDAAASDKVPKQAVRFKTATSQACHLI